MTKSSPPTEPPGFITALSRPDARSRGSRLVILDFPRILQLQIFPEGVWPVPAPSPGCAPAYTPRNGGKSDPGGAEHGNRSDAVVVSERFCFHSFKNDSVQYVERTADGFITPAIGRLCQRTAALSDNGCRINDNTDAPPYRQAA